MRDLPETRYADTRDAKIAFQVVGDGPIDLLVHPPLYLSVDMLWEEPMVVRFLDRLSSFCRHIWFDNRGRGASDPAVRSEGRFFETIIGDMESVLDTLECPRAAVLDLGSSAGFLFAATHPDRTTALITHHPFPFLWPAEDFLAAGAQEWIERSVATFLRDWGTLRSALMTASGAASNPHLARWLTRSQRVSCPPAEAARRWRNVVLSDMRSVLPTISVPNLVLTGTQHRAVAESQYLAEHIVGAQLVEVPDSDLFFLSDGLINAVERFLTGRLRPPDVDRVLATVLFTDIAASTRRASDLGDRAWKELLERFRATVREQLEHFRGREINTRGDDFMATFDGPGRAIQCALAITDATRTFGVEVRSGLHTGEIEVMNDDIGGIAVHIGARVAELARAFHAG